MPLRGSDFRRQQRNNERMQVLPPGSVNQRQAIRDPWMGAAAASQSFGQLSTIKFGTITDTTAIANCYRVQLEKGTATTIGVAASQASSEIFGAKPIGTYVPGTPVIVMEHRQCRYVVILGAFPRPTTDPRLALGDFIAQTSRLNVDEAHRLPILMPGGAVDWSAGRPNDATTVGEQGFQTETGLRIFIDPFMVQLAVDELCGITGFYFDQQLRIAGYNLQVLTAGSSREAMNDEGEYNDYTGWTPYPWEQAGQLTRADAFKALDAQEWQVDASHYSAIEPKNDRAYPFHRSRSYQGYLGQGGLRQVVCPPPEAETNGLNAFAGMAPAVFQEWVGLDGRYVLGSARGISIVKRRGITAPGRKRLANDPEGDNASNYKAAGQQGEGLDHKIKSTLGTQTDTPARERINGVKDLHAYIFNYASVQPFVSHDKDFATSDTSSVTPWLPDYSELQSKQNLSEPSTVSHKVDDRYGRVEYFNGEAGIDITDDGSVVIYSAYGSKIVLGPNGVEIDAPGDITFRSGKSIINWGGKDIILRAKNSMDLTTTTNDVRIKAEKDVQIIGGSGGTGGIMLESRSLGDSYEFEEPGEGTISSGIILRSPYSKIVTQSAGVYVRTGGPRMGSGPIVLDAGRGKDKIITNSESNEHYIRNKMVIWYASGSGEQIDVKKCAEFTPSENTLSGSLRVDGQGVFTNALSVRGGILVAEGHITTQQAEQAGGFVGSLSGGSLAQVGGAITAAKNAATKTIPKEGVAEFKTALKAEFYDDGKPGNNDLMPKMQASLRRDKDYHGGEGPPADYAIHGSEWQKNGQPWQEIGVAFGSEMTYPHPGKSALTALKVFYPSTTSELRLSNGGDASHGPADDLADAYDDPKYAQVEPKTLNEGYTTTV